MNVALFGYLFEDGSLLDGAHCIRTEGVVIEGDNFIRISEWIEVDFPRIEPDIASAVEARKAAKIKALQDEIDRIGGV